MASISFSGVERVFHQNGKNFVALQNVNLMLGLPETLGLERSPLYP